MSKLSSVLKKTGIAVAAAAMLVTMGAGTVVTQAKTSLPVYKVSLAKKYTNNQKGKQMEASVKIPKVKITGTDGKVMKSESEKLNAAISSYQNKFIKDYKKDVAAIKKGEKGNESLTSAVKWFGNTIYEQKSSTGTSITFLTELYELTQNEAYLDAAVRAGMFVKEYIIDRVRFNGGVHDSIYAKGQLIDNESILYPMFGMLSLYETTRKKEFLDAAVRAAHYFASWVCMWDVPLPAVTMPLRTSFAFS